jgi:hypothetical protein
MVIVILGCAVLVFLFMLRNLFQVRARERQRLEPLAMVERLLGLWGKVPVAQGQFTVAAVCILSTTTRYVLSSDHPLRNGQIIATWQPTTEWLMFLLALAGVASAHGIGKRMTDMNYVEAKERGKTAPKPEPSQP